MKTSVRVPERERAQNNAISDQEKYLEHHRVNFPTVPRLSGTCASRHTHTHTNVLCRPVLMGSAVEIIMFKYRRLKINEQ